MKNKKNIALLTAFVFTLASCSDFTNEGNDKRTQQDNTESSKPTNNGGTLPPELQKPNEGEFSEAKMLANIGLNVIAPAVRSFTLQTELLKNEVTNLCQAMTGSDSKEQEEATQAQWKKAMLEYHFISAAPIGPVTDRGRVIGDYLYSWPYLDLCGIDNEVLRLKESGVPDRRLLFNMKGLGALEYLLFDSSLQSRCNSRAYPKTVEWNALSAAEKKKDRCEFAKVLSEDLLAKAKELDEAWDPQKGNFTKTLVDGSRYKNLNEATNALTDSLFALEKIKDQKLGRTVGRHKDCTDESGKCADSAEHPWSGLALKAMESQLRGYQAVFFGSKVPAEKAFGFDDFLASRSHPEVGNQILNYSVLAIETAKTLAAEGTILEHLEKMDVQACKQTTIENRLEPLCALHEEIRTISTTMKVDVLSLLSLRAPPTHQGDND